MGRDRIEGGAKTLGGRVKEFFGRMLGDTKLRTEGRMDQAEGKIQNTVGGVKGQGQSPRRRQARSMMVWGRAVLIAALLGTSAAAQTGGTPVETPPVPLSLEKQAAVKQHMEREKPSEAQTGGPVTVGMIVPESVELWSLPQDSVTEVPATTSYRFLRTGGGIAVVDPENRRVIQIIPN